MLVIQTAVGSIVASAVFAGVHFGCIFTLVATRANSGLIGRLGVGIGHFIISVSRLVLQVNVLIVFQYQVYEPNARHIFLKFIILGARSSNRYFYPFRQID